MLIGNPFSGIIIFKFVQFTSVVSCDPAHAKIKICVNFNPAYAAHKTITVNGIDFAC